MLTLDEKKLHNYFVDVLIFQIHKWVELIIFH
jgi:hypothetical protein